MSARQPLSRLWSRVGTGLLPFADAASRELPLSRLLRLSLFQVSVGMALALLNGTLNRVMIVELAVPAWLVSLMVALPILFAPARAFVGFRSDRHRSHLGWRRVPYLWFGTLVQFGGFAIMPFALLLLSGDHTGPGWLGPVAAALAFLMVGAGVHTTQTAGLALAGDLAPPDRRPRVVALLYVMLLVGTVTSALLFGVLLDDFDAIRLIRVIQGAALVTMVLNGIALWKQEPRSTRDAAAVAAAEPGFRHAWRALVSRRGRRRLLVGTGLGTAGFNMQDILLEPFGGQVLRLDVGATASLTALIAGGALIAFAIAAHRLAAHDSPQRLAAAGVLTGIVAFTLVLFAEPLGTVRMFQGGCLLLGIGGGLFSVAMLTLAMDDDGADPAISNGLLLGAWGAVQATASGLAIAAGGALRDAAGALVAAGVIGIDDPAFAYAVVYQLEILLLFATLVAIGPLAGARRAGDPVATPRLGLAELPG